MSRSLPPLNALRAFEAAARHLSFSRAAEELGVTQGAISKHIIALEDFIGAQVFVRASAGLSLTQEGYTLTEALRPAFTMMTDAFAHDHRRAPTSAASPRLPLSRVSCSCRNFRPFAPLIPTSRSSS